MHQVFFNFKNVAKINLHNFTWPKKHLQNFGQQIFAKYLQNFAKQNILGLKEIYFQNKMPKDKLERIGEKKFQIGKLVKTS